MRPRALLTGIAAMLVIATGAGLASARAAEPDAAWLGILMGRLELSDGGGEAVDAAPPGVPIRFVIAESPAEAAGLRSRDRVLSVDGQPVSGPAELLALLRGHKPGAWVPITYERRGHEYDTRVELGERPSDLNRVRMIEAWSGAALIDLPPALRGHFGAPEDSGAMVAEVAPGSPAEAAGLRLGDVVFELDGQPVESGQAFLREIAAGGVGNPVELRVARDGVELVLEAVLQRAPEAAEPPR